MRKLDHSFVERCIKKVHVRVSSNFSEELWDALIGRMLCNNFCLLPMVPFFALLAICFHQMLQKEYFSVCFSVMRFFFNFYNLWWWALIEQFFLSLSNITRPKLAANDPNPLSRRREHREKEAKELVHSSRLPLRKFFNFQCECNSSSTTKRNFFTSYCNKFNLSFFNDSSN